MNIKDVFETLLHNITKWRFQPKIIKVIAIFKMPFSLLAKKNVRNVSNYREGQKAPSTVFKLNEY